MFSEIDIKKFFSKIKVGKPNECWPWLNAKYSNWRAGTSIKINGKRVETTAYRISWMIYHKKDIPKGMVIMHLCDQPFCCNPNHLQLGTYKQNSDDMVKKGRSKCSEGRKLKIRQNNRLKYQLL